MDEVGLLTVEDRTPWVPSASTRGGLGRRSWRLKNQVARALVDQDQLEDSSFNVFDPDEAILGAACGPPGALGAAGGLWPPPNSSRVFFSGSNGLINEAEDVSSPTHSLIFNQHNHKQTAAVFGHVTGAGQHAKAKSTPAVDFPFQFNFGSIYSSSLTIYFDN